MKTLLALLVASGLMVSLSTAAIAGLEDCMDGESWDEATESCVPDES